jgi:ribosomal-protein-alanine N-acetyltransferase
MTKDFRILDPIITSRLKLEIINLSDHNFIISLVNSRGWLENIGERNVHSKNDAVKYINKILSTDNFIYWVVRIKDENTPIGIISFLKRSYLENFDIGFAFLPEFNNKGYAYEAANEVLKRLTKFPEFNIVLASTLFSNNKSIKLLSKLGFTFEKEIEIENEKLHIYTSAKIPEVNL